MVELFWVGADGYLHAESVVLIVQLKPPLPFSTDEVQVPLD